MSGEERRVLETWEKGVGDGYGAVCMDAISSFVWGNMVEVGGDFWMFFCDFFGGGGFGVFGVADGGLSV